MKSFLILMLLFTTSIFANTLDCYKEVTQADKNECMAFERDQAIGRLVKNVTEKCADENEISDSQGGSIYPMLLDECMAKEFNKLAKDKEED